MSRDYDFSVVDNRDGSLCPSYPLEIVIPEALKQRMAAGRGGTQPQTEADKATDKETARDAGTPGQEVSAYTQQLADSLGLTDDCPKKNNETTASASTAHLVPLPKNDGEQDPTITAAEHPQAPATVPNKTDHEDPIHRAPVQPPDRHGATKDTDDVSASSTTAQAPEPAAGDSANRAPLLEPFFRRARFARARQRFAVPVLLLPNGRTLCRSGTLSHEVEVLFHRAQAAARSLMYAESDAPGEDPLGQRSIMEQQRSMDIDLLRVLGVSFIADLMVENRKKKYGLHVCSSEKIDSHGRYSDFHIAAVPYPGCEFFRDFKDNKHVGR